MHDIAGHSKLNICWRRQYAVWFCTKWNHCQMSCEENLFLSFEIKGWSQFCEYVELKECQTTQLRKIVLTTCWGFVGKFWKKGLFQNLGYVVFGISSSNHSKKCVHTICDVCRQFSIPGPWIQLKYSLFSKSWWK